MPIWHLEEREDADIEEWSKKTPGAPPYYVYGSTKGYVLVAGTEDEARALVTDKDNPWWSNKELTFCKNINDENSPRIIMGNYPTG